MDVHTLGREMHGSVGVRVRGSDDQAGSCKSSGSLKFREKLQLVSGHFSAQRLQLAEIRKNQKDLKAFPSHRMKFGDEPIVEAGRPVILALDDEPVLSKLD